MNNTVQPNVAPSFAVTLWVTVEDEALLKKGLQVPPKDLGTLVCDTLEALVNTEDRGVKVNESDWVEDRL
jgi:hypothetical protein